LDALPDDFSLETTPYHIYVRERIEHGLDAVKAGQIVSHVDAEERLSRWIIE